MKVGFRKVRSPTLRAKRNDRRRRRRTDPFLQQPRKVRKDGLKFAPVGDGFSMHGAKRRMETDTEFVKALRGPDRFREGDHQRHPAEEMPSLFRRALKRVWRVLRGKEKA